MKKLGRPPIHRTPEARKAADKAKAKRYRDKNYQASLDRNNAWRHANPDKVSARRAKWNAENHWRMKGYSDKWRLANPDKVRIRGQNWRANNPGKVAERGMRRYAQKVNATVSWANDWIMEEIYDLAVRRTSATGVEWQVDHIVPLCSPLVCGLHVEHNLQVITALENRSKGNRYWPDMPGV